jgi:hypothetical protein
MTYSEKKRLQQIQLEKDNIYLVKQMFKLAANKSEILIRLKAHLAKYPRNEKPKRAPIHITRLVKYLGVNRRTIYLLMDKNFLTRYISFDIRMFDCVEVTNFIKSLPNNNS